MATEAQIFANRRNALCSTGPRTAEGKERASQNAVKHGLLSKQPILRCEDRDEYDIFIYDFIEDLAPRGAVQNCVAEQAAMLAWKLYRIPRLECAVVGLGMNDSGREFCSGGPQVE
jgi:hypothetical protein